MKVLIKNLGLIWCFMGTTSILFAAGTAGIPPEDLIAFYFYHVKTQSPYAQPEAGNVSAHIKAFQKGFLGIIAHRAKTPEEGLTLDAHSNDFTVSGTSPDPYGRYSIDISCDGTKKFVGQQTQRHSTVNVIGMKNVRMNVHIKVACPVNDSGTTLLAPQMEVKVTHSN